MKSIVLVITYGTLEDTGPPLKFQKSSAPGKHTTSKFSSTPKIKGIHTL